MRLFFSDFARITFSVRGLPLFLFIKEKKKQRNSSKNAKRGGRGKGREV